MRISDWSSDVCSSDLTGDDVRQQVAAPHQPRAPGLHGSDHASSPAFRRTPRPPAGLALFSPISSTPATSIAAITLLSESMMPRTFQVLASMRWIVGSDTPASCARVRWSIPKIGRAHVCTPGTNAHLVCHLLLEQQH